MWAGPHRILEIFQNILPQATSWLYLDGTAQSRRLLNAVDSLYPNLTIIYIDTDLTFYATDIAKHLVKTLRINRYSIFLYC